MLGLQPLDLHSAVTKLACLLQGCCPPALRDWVHLLWVLLALPRPLPTTMCDLFNFTAFFCEEKLRHSCAKGNGSVLAGWRMPLYFLLWKSYFRAEVLFSQIYQSCSNPARTFCFLICTTVWSPGAGMCCALPRALLPWRLRHRPLSHRTLHHKAVISIKAWPRELEKCSFPGNS